MACTSIVISLALLALLTFAGFLLSLRRTASEVDVAAVEVKRIEGLRPALPSRGTVGYFSDTGGREQNARAYYLTQYSLAPVVVAADINHEYVVGNFWSTRAIVPFAEQNGFRVVTDLGNGIVLFRRNAQ